MTDPDDEALSWDGDDRLQAPGERPPRLLDGPSGRRDAGGSVGLVVVGVLGGIALLEAVLWFRSALEPSIAGTLGAPGTPAQTAAFLTNAAGRVLAVLAPLVWFGAVAWRVRAPSRRLAWLVLGAVLLLPWPALLGIV